MRKLLFRYADLTLGFVDTAVMVVVEPLGERNLATPDRRYFSTAHPPLALK